jgi:tetratricopeptide (TPR) repeat protein
MCKPPRLRNSPVLAIILLTAQIVCACSPDFPNSLIDNDSEVLAPPPADFLYELRQIPPSSKPPFRYIKRSTTEAELQDLAEALRGSPDAARTIETYTKLRGEIDAFLNARDANDAAQPLLPPRPLDVTIPPGLPEEFLRYVRGAVAYHNGKTARAISLWRTVLDLPVEQRRYRSTWATFMIGRALMSEKPDEAIRYFEQARTLAQKGFIDSLGLAALSYGWEGRIALDRQQFTLAADRYLLQLACDDPLAAWSLRSVALEVISAGPGDMNNAAKDGKTRRVITAFLVAEPGFRAWNGVMSTGTPNTNQILQWFAAVENCKATNLENCDRLAWIAYQKNLYVQADRWLNHGELTPLGHWVRAKLLLRDGKLSSAAAHLAEARRGLGQDLVWHAGDLPDREPTIPATRILGELGAIHLAQQQYTTAMNELLTADDWQDAAYIAERVLTVDELIHFVDDHFPADKPGSDNIRALLARRLMRLDRGDEALPYFTRELRDKAIAYQLALCDGHEAKRPAKERAELLWNAASIARNDGMELLGTELQPDNAIYGGSFPLLGVPSRLNPTITTIIPASADEVARAKRTEPDSLRRFHYRYLAADIAWEAIALMPDNDANGAARLCEAGGWLKAQDAKSADRFYKELVTRFAQTDLGAQAAKKHWFPK